MNMDFDLGQLEEEFGQEEDSFLALPAGDYVVQIKEAELRDTKAGTGKYIHLRLDVQEGEKVGRVIFTNVNIKNPNEIAEQIGKRHLIQIMRATGVQHLQQADQLVGGTLIVKLKVKKDPEFGDANGERNDVVLFKALNSTPNSSKSANNSVKASTSSAKPPWG